MVLIGKINFMHLAYEKGRKTFYLRFFIRIFDKMEKVQTFTFPI